jgi:hypothetical protein
MIGLFDAEKRGMIWSIGDLDAAKDQTYQEAI